ncbi:MAG: response regulator transcription factor [Thiotrichales bacterium]|nr:response regulator transcription factor [Thiotrichales bacterium]
MKILIIEDEPLLLKHLQAQFQAQQVLVDIAASLAEGRYYLAEFDYDALILDMCLPDGNGLQLLQHMRAQGGMNQALPVLVLSARNSWQEKVEGLKAGADDYLAKPYAFEELWLRLQRLVSRNLAKPRQSTLQHGAFILDLETKQLQVGTEHFALTLTEFRLLQAFFKNPQRVLSKEQLKARISEHAQECESNLIEVYVAKLRRMLGRNAIQTLRGLGYKFVPDGPMPWRQDGQD